jgi:RNA polymerase sigma factor for flagellar operon FliA
MTNKSISNSKNSNNAYDDDMKYYRDKLAVEYLPAVKSMAFRLKERLPSFIEYSDLVSIGTEELVKLSRRYDKAQNDSFWGYAKKRVYGSMLDYLRSLDIMSRNNRKLVKQIDSIIDVHLAKYNQEPSNEDLAEALETTVTKIKEARKASEIYTLLPISEGNDFVDDSKDTLKSIEQDDLISSIQDILETLTEREQLIIQLYYFEELNLKEISAILNITESRISQIHKAVIKKIKEDIDYN